VFSPYYAWARRRGPADPHQHCALNVALYGGGAQRWAMTERGRSAVHRSPDSLVIGPSTLTWNGAALEVRIDEIAVPLPRRVRGTVRLHPLALAQQEFILDATGRHHWAPLAPLARVEVALERPALRWSGAGYLDMNAGAAPLERDFVRWDWSCARTRDGAAVLYEVTPRAGREKCLALHFDRGGEVTAFDPPPPVALPRTAWRMPRGIRAEDGEARVVRGFEDAPFYARAEVAARLHGESVLAMHETVSLDRFRAPIVQAMLPFRMPRRAGAMAR
jgi:carotenoid 1,2-hydratase